jgi:hypothetical protein
MQIIFSGKFLSFLEKLPPQELMKNEEKEEHFAYPKMNDSSKSWNLNKQVTKPIKHLRKGKDLSWVWEEKSLDQPKTNLWVVTEKGPWSEFGDEN